MKRIIAACLWALVVASSPLALAQQGKSPTIAVAATSN